MNEKLPLTARLLILAVAAEGVALMVLRTIDATKWNGRELLTWLALTGGIALAISLVERKSYRTVLLPPLRANVLHFAGNTVIGLAGAMLWTASPYAFPAVALPLGMAFVIYRFLAVAARHRAEAGPLGA